MLKAAVVHAFGVPPSVQEFREPVAGPDESIIKIYAAALSPIVKRLASGQHYTSGASAGFIAGVDGVGMDEAGCRVYFLFPKAPFGSMAEMALVANTMMVPIPDAVSSADAAAIANAGLASWIALSRRAKIERGETVLVLGATGASGAMALQIARHFGAGKIIAVGRNERKLDRLSADVKIVLDGRAGQALSEQFDQGVDIVLDFVWGDPAVRTLRAATKDRGSRNGEPRLRYVQIGTIAGDDIVVRGDMLRSTGLELLGSGIGSVAIQDLVAGAGELLAATPSAGFTAPYTLLPLKDVEETWNNTPDARLIFAPGS